MNRRSTQQNKLMWSLCNDVSNQVTWYGKKYSPKQWKEIFSAMLDGQEAVPALEGEGVIFVPTDTHNKEVQWHCDLVEYIHKFGALNNVKFTDTTYEYR